MAAELPRPGVEVVQVIRTTTPTVVTPTLVPCVVGVARQVVELLETSSSGTRTLNGDALVSIPAYFLAKAATGSPAVYTGLNGLSLKLVINNSPSVTVLFSDVAGAGLTPASVVNSVNVALAAAGNTSAVAEVKDDAFWVRTYGIGQFNSIEIDSTTSPAVLTAFGIGAGKTYFGVDNYAQAEVPISAVSYPDPRDNLANLSIEAESVRVFLAMSASNFVEASRTEAFLRKGAVATAAVVTGSVDLTTLTLPTAVENLTLIVSDSGGTAQTVTFTSSETSVSAVLAKINADTTGLVATAAATTNYLVITSDTLGATGSITIGAGTANTVLGLTTSQTDSGESIEVVDDGNGDSFSPLVKFLGADFTAVGVAAAVTGSVALTGLAFPSDLAGKTLELSDGQQVQTVTFSATIANEAAILSEINAVVGAAAGGRLVASADGTHHLVLTHTRTGADSVIWVKGGTAVTTLGLVADTLVYGTLGKVLAGDEVFVDGVSYGTVLMVAPGGLTNTLKLSTQKVITLNAGTNWYVRAKGLTAVPAAGRPYPELVVDSLNTATVKPCLLRDTNGNPVHPTQGRAPLYLAYTAIRKDVTATASRGLLRMDSQTQLEDTLSPVSVQNPLALGLFFALVNAPGAQVTGLGVDAVSADSPYGTVEAYTRAAEYLESFEVYSIAPLTHDQTVGQLFSTHATAMSAPSQKGERIVLFNGEQPTTALDTLVASGVDGNTVGNTGLSFDTGVPNLSALLLSAGVNPVGTIDTTLGVFLDIASDSKHYSISAVNGSVVIVRTTFAAGTNDDSFYSSTALNVSPLPSQLISEAFAVRVRGAALVTVNGDPDKNAVAATYAARSQSFGNRRFWNIAPDQCAATIGGLEQTIPGFYMCAAIAGMIAQQPPQQSFTNFPIAGFTRVIGSSEYLTEQQMNVMAAGGTYIIVQDSPSSPCIARMALTTDMTSVETRTDSITKVVDFVAKFLRRGLKNFIGRFNINQAFLDQLGTVTSGLGGYLTECGILNSFHLNGIVQDEDQPDTVLIDVLIDPPYPCNYIRLTLTL